MAEARLVFLQAETPVHPGAGDTAVGIDLPVQRSVTTRWPVIYDSTLRGGLRRRLSPDVSTQNRYFGSEAGDDRHPGSITTPDAELLLFPVAAPRGQIAWVTSLQVLQNLLRRFDLFKSTLPTGSAVLRDQLAGVVNGLRQGTGRARVSTTSAVSWPDKAGKPTRVVVEADTFDADAVEAVDDLAAWLSANAMPVSGEFWNEWLRGRLVVLPEAAFDRYVRTRTDIRTRIVVEGGTAKNLWTEENLPVDCVFHTVLSEIPRDGAVSASLGMFLSDIGIGERPVAQFGGDQGLGRGWMRLRELGN